VGNVQAKRLDDARRALFELTCHAFKGVGRKKTYPVGKLLYLIVAFANVDVRNDLALFALLAAVFFAHLGNDLFSALFLEKRDYIICKRIDGMNSTRAAVENYIVFSQFILMYHLFFLFGFEGMYF
jgi:hypothetical protein